MLPAILLVLAIFFSWHYLVSFLGDSINVIKGRIKEGSWVSVAEFFIALILWGAFYYVTH
jgi:hypothetical protein